MPWELTITKEAESGGPALLGMREAVRAAFSNAFPGVELAAPPAPPTEFLEKLPAALRSSFLNRNLSAVVEVGECHLEFYCSDADEIEQLNVEVRGNESPLPIIAALCEPNGWTARDASGNELDLSTRSSSEWQRYCLWRDRAIQSLSQMG